MLSTAATRGRKRLGRVELEAGRLRHDEAVGREVERVLGRAACRYCRRPAPAAPGAAASSPVSAVVVVLPLVPVMAMTSASITRHASSSSPMIGTPRARTAASAGSSSGTPGLTTTSSAPAKAASGWPPVQRRAAERSSAARLRRSSASRGARVGGEHAAARGGGSAAPRRPRSWRGPTTATVLPGEPLRGTPRPAPVRSRRSPSDTDIASQRHRDAIARHLAKLERGERQQRQHEGQDPEADDDLGLRPALASRSGGAAAPSEDALARSA